MQITMREYQNQDFDTLLDIIRKTWHYDEFNTPKTAKKLAAVFLSSCLTNYTFSRVALIDGKVVGIILLNHIEKHHCPLRNRLRQIRSLFSLYLSKEGRKAMKIFGSVNGIDKLLLKELDRSYPAELALFAVSDSCRGKGIGKALFQEALNYAQKQQLETFYLFTDTSCNYGFYEHQGMIRCGEKEHTFQVEGQTANMHFFLYKYPSARLSQNTISL